MLLDEVFRWQTSCTTNQGECLCSLYLLTSPDYVFLAQAYECLSDNHKRHTFNLERSKSFCVICSLPPLNTCILAVPQTNRATYACQSHLVTVTDDNGKGKQDAERLEILQERERARARVSMLDKEWGIRHSKWLQQLASVREKFQTYQYDLIPPPKSRTAYAHHHLFSSLHSQFHWSEGEYKRNVATSVTDLSLKSTLPAQARRPHHMRNDSYQERPHISNNLLSSLKPKSEAAFPQASARTEKLGPEFSNVTIPVEEGETIMKEFLEGIRKCNRPANAFVSPLSEIGLLYTDVEPTTWQTYHSLKQGQSEQSWEEIPRYFLWTDQHCLILSLT